jgi:NADH-quinone oxidoreductase subunit N
LNAPLIWILLPLSFVPILLVLKRYRSLVINLSSLLTGMLALLAWQLPLEKNIKIASMYLKVDSSWSILGRTFTLDTGDRGFLVMIYLIAALWFFAAHLTDVNLFFIPLGMGMIVCLVATLAVEPFLYAALLIEMAVLLSIPMLSPPGEPIHQGTLRYLIFQTLPMPFILLTGWMLTGVDANPGDPGLVLRVEALLALGFAFLLAVFPFYSWIPLLSEKAHPFVSGFVLIVLQTVVLLFGINFLDRYAWLRSSTNLYEVLSLTGTLMVVTAGLWAAFQRNLGRILGYAVIAETGYALLAVSQANSNGLEQFSMLFLPRILGIGIWALALSTIRQRLGSLELQSVRGLGKVYPVLAAGLVLAHFSVAGMPLLANFPIKLAILGDLAQGSSTMAAWILIGTIGLMAAGLRTLAEIAREPQQDLILQSAPRTPEIALGMGVLVLLIIGIFPQLFLPVLLNILKSFTHLAF